MSNDLKTRSKFECLKTVTRKLKTVSRLLKRHARSEDVVEFALPRCSQVYSARFQAHEYAADERIGEYACALSDLRAEHDPKLTCVPLEALGNIIISES